MGRGQLDLELVDLTAPIADAAAQLDRACRELGFFLVPLSVVPADVANQAWDAAHRFFALPEATKRQVGFPEPGYPYGWSPFGFESLSASLDDAGARNAGARKSVPLTPVPVTPMPMTPVPTERGISRSLRASAGRR